MKISDMIKELQERMELYGDSEVVFRDSCGDTDIDICSAYYDEDEGRAVLSDFEDPF